jgi:hypothetical protein
MPITDTQMAMQTKVLSKLIALMLVASAAFAGDPLGNASLRGPIHCSLTGAKFPDAVGEPLAVTYAGSMDLVADGAGKFVSGHMTTHGAGDIAIIRNSRYCDFNLSAGIYMLNSDGTGHSETSWNYLEGGGSTLSDQVCSDNFLHPQHFQGLDLNNMRKERTRVTESFVVASKPDGMMYWVGLDENGATVAVCKRAQ